MKGPIPQILVLCSLVLVAIVQVEAMGEFLDLRDAKAGSSASHASSFEHPDSVPLIRQDSHDIKDLREEEISPNHRSDLPPRTDKPEKKKKFSAKKVLKKILKGLGKFFKFMISGPVNVHRTGRTGFASVPRYATFHLPKHWPEMEADIDTMRKALKSYSLYDFEQQRGSHFNAISLFNLKDDTETRRQVSEFIRMLRNGLEESPGAQEAMLEKYEQEKQILSVKALYALRENKMYSREALEALQTAIKTIRSKPESDWPPIYRYMKAAEDLLLKDDPPAETAVPRQDAHPSDNDADSMHSPIVDLPL